MARRRHGVPAQPEPFLRAIRTVPEAVDPSAFPFSVPALSLGVEVELSTKVAFFVGENGCGKSTLLEAVAAACGFHLLGGSRDHRGGRAEEVPLAKSLRLSWLPKVTDGFFLRAESFFDFSRHIDDVGSQSQYGGDAPLLEQSHGESFLSLFLHRFRQGLFILDEPEAALSPQRQLTFLKILHDLERTQRCQFLIATHSPILLLYPGAQVFSLDREGIAPIDPRETDHVRLTRDFLAAPEKYLRALFASDDDEPQKR